MEDNIPALFSKPTYSKIAGTGSYIPEGVLTNHDLELLVNTSDDWIIRRTGIKERRIVGGQQFASDMAAEATGEALGMAGLTPSDLDLIVLGTLTPDRQFPSCACTLQHKIGALNAAAMDVSAGCSGFIYALSVAHNAIRCGEAEHALVIGTELLYSVDHVLSQPSRETLSRAGPAKPYYLVMDGQKLFKRAVRCLEEVARMTLDKARVAIDELALMVPHQANLRIINTLAERLGVSGDKVCTTVQKYGNTSSSSIPIALDEARKSGRMFPLDKILMVTFGAGLTWGAAVVEWNP